MGRFRTETASESAVRLMISHASSGRRIVVNEAPVENAAASCSSTTGVLTRHRLPEIRALAVPPHRQSRGIDFIRH